MLAHLAVALRMRLMLTTNFDTLLESSFETLGMPLTVFQVPREVEELPSPRLVNQHQSLVKLHGSAYGLRADMSLDAEPSTQDRQIFREYFDSQNSGTRNLLVLGVGGKEKRINHLIASLLKPAEGGDGTIPDIKIFWQCFHDYEMEEHRTRLKEFLPRSANIDEILFTTTQRHLGLFLYEIYQSHFLALPPAGADYAASIRLPPLPYGVDPYVEDTFNPHYSPQTSSKFYVADHFLTAKKELLEAIETQGSTDVLLFHGETGTSSVAASLFHELTTRNLGCWIDLDTCADLNDFKLQLLETLALQLGHYHTLFPLPQLERSIFELVEELLEKSVQPVICFLYLREGLGPNAGWTFGTPEPYKDLWRPEDIQALGEVLDMLSENCGSRLRFLIVDRDDSRAKVLKAKALKPCQQALSRQLDQIVDDIVAYCKKDESGARGRFVYTMTLFRRTRYRSALLSWTMTEGDGDYDAQRAKKAEEWLKELGKIGLFRVQSGGFIWMHDDVRTEVRRRLSERPQELRDGHDVSLNDFHCRRHQSIADWYVKLFRSSNDPRAIDESIYHRVRCLVGMIRPCVNINEPLLHSTLRELQNTLDLAHRRFVDRAFADSYVPMLVRLAHDLETYLENDVKPSLSDASAAPILIDELRGICLKLAASMAREVGDFREALRIRGFSAGASTELLLQESNLASDFKKANRVLEWGICISCLRDYDAADKAYREALSILEAKWPISVAESATLAMKLECHTAAGEQKLKNICKVLRRLLLLHLLQAQALELKATRAASTSARNSLLECEKIYNVATSLMRYISDAEFLQQENVYFRTHFGIALARLGRSKEGLRRLNEASGYLARSVGGNSGVQWAVIDLRRAEIQLVGKQLDDTEFLLDRAERRLSSAGQNSWWWTWLYHLRLETIYKKLQSRDHSSDRVESLRQAAKHAFCHGTQLIREDIFRFACIIDWYSKIEGPSKNSKRLDDSRKRLALIRDSILESGYQPNERILRYVQLVIDDKAPRA